MTGEYCDRDGNPMTKQEAHCLPAAELSERSGLSLNILPDTDSLYESIARIMVDTIVQRKGGKVTMILPVGPIGQYPAFAAKVKEQGIDFRGTMMASFFERMPADLRMPAGQMFFPAHDCMDEMDRAFDEHAPDGVDLCLAGVGPEGHFAFNEDPNFRHVVVSEEEFLADRTRLVQVNTSTVDMDALVASSGDRSAIPPFAVTIGPHDVLRAKRTEVLFFAGPFQRYAPREMLFRRPTMRFPGTLLKLRKQPDGTLAPQNITIWATAVEAEPVTTQTI